MREGSVAAERETGGIDGTRWRRAVEQELMVGSNIESPPWLVFHYGLTEGDYEEIAVLALCPVNT